MSLCATEGCNKKPFRGKYCKWCSYQIAKNGKATPVGIPPVSTDPTLADESDHAVSSEKAVKTYVDSCVDSYGFKDRGDPSNWDWTLVDFTTDGDWHDLDCSSIVPAGAVAILFRVDLKDDQINSHFYMSKKGNVNVYNVGIVRSQVANNIIDGQLIVPCDLTRVIQYSTLNTTFSDLNILIRGWWI